MACPARSPSSEPSATISGVTSGSSASALLLRATAKKDIKVNTPRYLKVKFIFVFILSLVLVSGFCLRQVCLCFVLLLNSEINPVLGTKAGRVPTF